MERKQEKNVLRWKIIREYINSYARVKRIPITEVLN